MSRERVPTCVVCGLAVGSRVGTTAPDHGGCAPWLAVARPGERGASAPARTPREGILPELVLVALIAGGLVGALGAAGRL